MPEILAVNMIYRPRADSGHHDALSLWIKVYRENSGGTTIEQDHIYTGSATDTLHPLLVWRNDPMIYYLTGNATSPMIDAAAALRLSVG